MDTGTRGQQATRPPPAGTHRGRWLRAVVITGALTWLMTAGGAPAANVSTAFIVSVQVVGRCRLEHAEASSRGRELLVACPRGTGYQILVDGRPAGAGANGGVVRILPLTATANGDPDAQLHWLTILY